ncbi:Uncharacterized protein TCM_040730 [Theobroma cacao]|uniref:Uncharacterized protein n=1 Tax=Theobroma cacao TaxID=3641 RepID=A0A061GZA7_THECC|nr:Uncharacterized protein TCM_040730 [Theobroma cacao]
MVQCSPQLTVLLPVLPPVQRGSIFLIYPCHRYSNHTRYQEVHTFVIIEELLKNVSE